MLGVILALAMPTGAAAQGTTQPPSTSPPSTGGTSTGGSTSGRRGGGGVGVGLNLSGLLSGDKGPCDRIVEQLGDARERLVKKDCDKEEAEVEAAKANLASARAAIDAERARRDVLRAEARQAGAQSRAAAAALATAQAQLAAAQQALANGNAAVTQALQSYFQVGGNWYRTSQPATGQWIGIEIQPGLTIYMQDDYGEGFWTPTRVAEMRSQIQKALSGKQGKAALAALQKAQAQLAAAQAALAAAEDAAAAAAQAYEAADKAASNLPPADLPLADAEKRLEAALKALEKCQEEKRALAARITQLQVEVDDCRRRELLDAAAAGSKADSDRTARAAASELDQARSDAAHLTRYAGKGTTPADDRARDNAAATSEQVAAAEARLKMDQAAAARADAARRAAETTEEFEAAAAAAAAAREQLLKDLEEARRLRVDAEEDQVELEGARARAQQAEDRAAEDARRREAAAAQAAKQKQEAEALTSELDDLAGEMAEGTAKEVLGTLSETLGNILRVLDGVQTAADMPANRVLFLKQIKAVLGAVLQGNLAECRAQMDGLAVVAGRMSGSDAVTGLGYVGHWGYSSCETLIGAATNNPELRRRMERVRDRLTALVG